MSRAAPTTPPRGQASYRHSVTRLQRQYAAHDDGGDVRLAKSTSNLFRVRAEPTGAALRVQEFQGVLDLDRDARTADVLGMTRYRDLVDVTLAEGLVPLVVPQLGTITLGGAVAGLGIESTSFRAGCPHESVLEMDVLTGDGRVVTATASNEHADLFWGFPNSYGTLGYALRLRIELERVRPFVHLEHHRFRDAHAVAATIASIVATGQHHGRPVDYLDGVVLDRDRLVLTLGRGVQDAPYTSDYTGRAIYWRSLGNRDEDYLTVGDYLWRWDTDWFWCSRAFGVQNRWVRPVVPRRLKRSEMYWKAISTLRRSRTVERYDRVRGRQREFVIQDVEVPVGALADFLAFFADEVGMLPVWLCPLRQRDPSVRWTTVDLDPTATYVNVGFWGSVEVPVGTAPGMLNRRIEAMVAQLGGYKSLYSDSYYTPQEFAERYAGARYAALKERYDPDARLLDLYAKCVANA